MHITFWSTTHTHTLSYWGWRAGYRKGVEAHACKRRGRKVGEAGSKRQDAKHDVPLLRAVAAQTIKAQDQSQDKDKSHSLWMHWLCWHVCLHGTTTHITLDIIFVSSTLNTQGPETLAISGVGIATEYYILHVSDISEFRGYSKGQDAYLNSRVGVLGRDWTY